MNNRYMIITYIKKPNGKWDEYTEFRNNIKMSHLQTAKVVLDFKNKKCVVNSINPEATFDDMLEFYKRTLGDQLTPHLPQESP
jgi:hypothetical protein